MADLYARLLAHLEQPWEIWAPVKAADVLGPQRLALRALVERHKPRSCTYEGCKSPAMHKVCSVCGGGSTYPCTDIQVIADQLGFSAEGTADE